ncbi:MAG: hypothetical protein AAF465_04175 [Pseudomonadota bacterium]
MNALPDISWRERFILLTALAFVAMSILAGPMRMYLSMAGLSPLIYVPNLMLLMAIAWQIADQAYRGITPLQLIGVLIPVYLIIVGFQFGGVIQTAMGVYVLLPFWFGLACCPVLFKNWDRVARFIPVLYIVATSGVLINYVVTYPWEGFGYNVGNLDVEGSRQWYASGGVKRLAGLSRASFDAAVHIILFGILFALTIRNPLLRMTVWVLTFVAAVPTNSKGMLLVVVVLTPVILLREKLPRSFMTFQLAFFAALAMLLPLSTLLFEFHSQFSNPTLANATYSFYDRLNDMWPRAWLLLHEEGHWLMGRGIGGIGTSQTYFEPSLFNAGDNLFMYWFVVLGWSGLLGFLLILLRSLRLKPNESPAQMRIYCLFMALMVYGSMTNIVENSVFALVCGLLVRWLCSSPTTVVASRSDQWIPPSIASGRLAHHAG